MRFIIGLIFLSFGVATYFLRVEFLYTELLFYLPSFFHIVAFSLLTSSKNFIWKIPFLWFGIDLIFEISLGTYDNFDVLALVLGLFTSILILRIFKEPRKTFFVIPLISGTLLTTGSYYCDASIDYEPLYISYEEFRESVKLEEPKQIEDSGKIYVYKDLLFVNEPKIGVHIFENSDKRNPKNIGFLKVIGNRDMAVKDGYLYLDSLVDLVVVDIEDFKEVNRLEDIFSYDYREMLGDEVWFRDEIDVSKGVVIGYKEIKNGSDCY
jgi:hypothetical protein